MANKIVKLTVHKNTAAKRQRHHIAKMLSRAARDINEDKAVTGYAVVAWTDKFDGRAYWHFEDVESSRSTPERVKQVLLQAMNSTEEPD